MASTNQFASSRSLFGTTARSRQILMNGLQPNQQSDHLDIQHQRNRSSGHNIKYGQTHKVPTPRQCQPSVVGSGGQAAEDATIGIESNRQAGRDKHRISISIKSQQSAMERRPVDSGFLTLMANRDELERTQVSRRPTDKTGLLQRSQLSKRQSQTEHVTRPGSQKWMTGKRHHPNKDLIIMPEQNIVEKIGGIDFYKDYNDLSKVIHTPQAGNTANESARQRIMQKSKNALQPLLVYHQQTDKEQASHRQLHQVTFGSVSPGSAETSSGRFLKKAIMEGASDPSKAEAYGSGVNSHEIQSLSPKNITDRYNFPVNEDIYGSQPIGTDDQGVYSHSHTPIKPHDVTLGHDVSDLQ